MICKKDYDKFHNILTVKFFSHKKCIFWTFFEIVEDKYLFDENIKNCFFAYSFEISNKIKTYEFEKIIENIKKLNDKIVIEVSNKNDKKIISFLLKKGFVNTGKNYYEFQKSF